MAAFSRGLAVAAAWFAAPEQAPDQRHRAQRQRTNDQPDEHVEQRRAEALDHRIEAGDGEIAFGDAFHESIQHRDAMREDAAANQEHRQRADQGRDRGAQQPPRAVPLRKVALPATLVG